MKTSRPVAVTFAILVLFSATARADLIEGFESGLLTPGSVIGDASISTPNFFGISPTQGTHQLVLTTINTLSDPEFAPISGTSAVSVTGIANFLGVPTASIRNGLVTGQEGSTFQIKIGALNPGDMIRFDYNFLTNEVQPGAHNDFAFITLTGMTGNTPVVADTFSLLTPTMGAGNPFVLETGYHTYSINIPGAGNYTLGIGVVDGTTADAPSALLIDNIQLFAVPEPNSIFLAIFGTGLLMALRGFKQRRAQDATITAA